MNKESSSKTSGLKRFIRRLILFILFIEAVTAAVLKVLEYFKTKKADEENPTRDFKEFFNFLGRKDVTLSDSNVSGVIQASIFPAFHSRKTASYLLALYAVPYISWFPQASTLRSTV